MHKNVGVTIHLQNTDLEVDATMSAMDHQEKNAVVIGNLVSIGPMIVDDT